MCCTDHTYLGLSEVQIHELFVAIDALVTLRAIGWL